MRKYDELSAEEQSEAESKAFTSLLEAIVSGALRFSDEKNGDDLQARIDAAMQKAEDMQTPWFAAEYVMDAATDELRGMALCDAEDAIYLEAGETAIRL